MASRPPPVQFKVRIFLDGSLGVILSHLHLCTLEHCRAGAVYRKCWTVLWLEKHKLKHTEKNIKVMLQPERQQPKALLFHPIIYV